MILIKHHNEGQLEPYFYFALEQYVLNQLLKGDETYFFTWAIKGIVCGKNQVIENEVNFPYVKANNIKVFRRPTGGGAVYADENNTMFSIITKRSKEQFSFKTYLGKLIEAFDKLGVQLEFSGRNDILLDGKKMSGNAFLQNKNGMLMHGTLMYDLDIETMVRALTPADEKLISKGIESVRSRVNNLKPYLGGMSHQELVLFLENNLTDQVYTLSASEVSMLQEHAKKYQTSEWLYQIQPPFTQVLKKRLSFGIFELRLDIKHGMIEHAKVHGDFFELKELTTLENAFVNQPYTYQSLASVLENHPLSEYILNGSNQAVLELFNDAFLNT